MVKVDFGFCQVSDPEGKVDFGLVGKVDHARGKVDHARGAWSVALYVISVVWTYIFTKLNSVVQVPEVHGLGVQLSKLSVEGEKEEELGEGEIASC